MEAFETKDDGCGTAKESLWFRYIHTYIYMNLCGVAYGFKCLGRWLRVLSIVE